jgi:hypothetical protein
MAARLRRVANLLRSNDHYRAHVFAAGLQRHGFVVEPKWQRSPLPEDALLIWNRTRGNEPIADIYERAGARVIIAENGFTPPASGKHYALFLDHHNGAGRWHVGDRPRHPIPEKPWRSSGDHVLVLPQRGIGERGIAMPSTWARAVLDRLALITDRPIVLRPHPGHRKNGEPDSLPAQLAEAHCAVTWGSGAGIKAMQAGIPVLHEFEQWIGGPGAARLDGQLERCDTPDRDLLWTRISWAQWTLEEIGSGEAFDRLLNTPRGDLFCAREQPVGDHRPGDVRGCDPPRPQCGAALVA